MNLKGLSDLGGIIAAATAASLCASVAYDWGYFRALGIAFDESPTVIADHARTGLIVLPLVALVGFGLLVLDLLTRRIEGGMTEEEIVSSSNNPERTARARARPYTFVFWTAIAALLTWVFLGESTGAFLAVPVLWGSFVSWVFSHPRLGIAVSETHFRAIYWIPATSACLYFVGSDAGRVDHESLSITHRIHLASTSSATAPIDVQLMRAFGQWSLTKDQDGNIAWIAQQEILRIYLLKEHTPFPGLACLVADWPPCEKIP